MSDAVQEVWAAVGSLRLTSGLFRSSKDQPLVDWLPLMMAQTERLAKANATIQRIARGTKMSISAMMLLTWALSCANEGGSESSMGAVDRASERFMTDYVEYMEHRRLSVLARVRERMRQRTAKTPAPPAWFMGGIPS